MSAGARVSAAIPPALSASAVRVRAITPDELRAFALFSSRPAYAFAPSRPEAFETWLRRYWDTGDSRPEWCFVAERDGQLVGSVVYEGAVRSRSAHVEHLCVPWRGEYPELGRHLLHESLRQLDARHGLEYVFGFLKTPPLTERARGVRRALLEHAGFTLRRQQLHYVWEPEGSPPPRAPAPRHPEGVVFRPLAEVGEAAWLAADARVRQASLVPDMAAGARRPGEPLFPPGHEVTDELRFWQLAYRPAGELIGLVATSRNGTADAAGTSGTISWIGVVPERRGRGYVDDLIARGLEILLAAGVKQVHADTHLQNTPMQAAFSRMGCRQTETRWWYEFDMMQLREPVAATRADAAAIR